MAEPPTKPIAEPSSAYSDRVAFPFIAPPEMRGEAIVHPVAIVGAGPIGLTLALALAKQGIRSIVLEDDDRVCAGSRAIGMSRRSLEIWDAVGAIEPIAARGLTWRGGRSFYRGRTVLEFEMADDPALKYRPMFNIQQSYTEHYLVAALLHTGHAELRWQSRFTGLTQRNDRVEFDVQTPQGNYRTAAHYVIACDGARSAVRSALGLSMNGTSYEASYVIADINLDTTQPVERRCWFDPPSNAGATILMHRQPDNVWRLDYQLREGEDPEVATRPENVIPRIQAHLDLIGENGNWTLEWVSMYRVHSRALDDFRHGRVFFAGDAAHLMPIFGIRGLNSGVEDSWNLAWKLSAVLRGEAPDALLDSYSAERRAVFLENTALAERNAWFMTPPSPGARVMRHAVLSLALTRADVQDILNPKQAAYVPLRKSPLCTEDDAADGFVSGPAPGDVLPDVGVTLMAGSSRNNFLHALLDPACATVLRFDDGPLAPGEAVALEALARRFPLRLVTVVNAIDDGDAPPFCIVDRDGSLRRRFDAGSGGVYLVRPDHNVAARWRRFDAARLEAALTRVFGRDRASPSVAAAAAPAAALSPAEELYRLLGDALSSVGGDKRELLLSKIALLMGLKLGDVNAVASLIDAARQDL